ncbi:MAG TPA: muconolactone Delta-isomerase family protein [Dongiaceae bacterium]|nr:muconolactone Delta-isomerase family protein [Dongiaceae bacterium]
MKILALEKQLPKTTEDRLRPYLKEEAIRVWELLQQGILREIYFRADARAAVLILECASGEEARCILNTLPLVREKLIAFDIVPLVPYPGLSRLFSAEL